MKKRIIAIVLASFLAIGAAGCSSTATPTPAVPDPTPVSGAETPAPTPSGPPAASPVTIRYSTWDYPAAAAYLVEAINVFNSTNDKGITVEAMEISSNEYNQKVATMLAGGEDVDVIDVKELPMYANYVKLGQLDPLNDYIARDNIDMSAYSGIDADLYVDGKIYAMPYRSDIELLFYNKDIFDAANEPYPANDMTLDEFRALAKKLTKGEGNDKIYGAVIHTWTSQVSDFGVAAGKGTMNDQEYEFLLPAYKTILAMQNEDKSVYDFGELRAANLHYSATFGTNANSAMLVMGTWYIGRLITENQSGQINVNWGIAKMPRQDESVPEGYTAGGVTPLGINSKSKNKDAAWEFIKFLSGEEGAIILAGMGTRPGWSSDAVIEAYTSAEGFPQDCKDALETANVYLQMPPNELGAAIKTVQDEEHQLIMIGEKTPEEGIAEMNRRIQEIYRDAGK